MRLLVRATILFTALYFLAVYILALFFNVQLFIDIYVILGEFVFCLLVSEQGKYHCRYMKWLAWAILLSDSLFRIDTALGFMSIGTLWILLLFIVIVTFILMIIFAVNHFVTVKKKKGDGCIGEHKGKS